MNKAKHIIHDNNIYELAESELFISYKKVAVPVQKPTPQWLGPKIPWDLWCELVAWCQVTQEKFKSEAMALLFFDLDKKTWSNWYPPQITNGMTVQTDEDSEEYLLQREHFPDTQFGSLHHHCTTKAFSSGVDQKDESNREGFHFTIGNLESKEHSVHFRICLNGVCHEMNPALAIEPSPTIAQLPEKYRMLVHSKMILEPQDASVWDFEEPLKNIVKKKSRHYTQTYGNGRKRSNIGMELMNCAEYPHTKLDKLNESEKEEIIEIIRENLAYYNLTKKTIKKPISNYLDIAWTDYADEAESCMRDGMVETTTYDILNMLGDDVNVHVRKGDIAWVNEFLSLFATNFENE